MDGTHMELVRRSIERYVPLNEAEWKRIAACWNALRSFPRNGMVSTAGKTEPYFYIVVSGVQRLYFEHDGTEHCLGFSYDHSWSGDLESFITQRPARFNVQAITESRLIGIAYEDLQMLYREMQVMERFGRLILEELIRGRATREIELLTYTAAERYDKLLQRSPHLLQLVPQKDIASYLRMTPETFSRLRSRS